MSGPRAGDADELAIFRTVNCKPTSIIAADAADIDTPLAVDVAFDGVQIGPFEPDSTNRARDVAVYPGGRPLNTGAGYTAQSGETYRIATTELAKAKISRRQRYGIKRDARLAGLGNISVPLSVRYASVPRFGVNVRNGSDASGDTLGVYRRLTTDFSPWLDSAGAALDALDIQAVWDANATLIGKPSIVHLHDRVFLVVLAHSSTATASNRLYVWQFDQGAAPSSVTYADPDNWILVGTSSSLGTLAGLSASTTGDVAACAWKDEIWIAAGTSIGTLGSVSFRGLSIIRFRPPPVAADGDMGTGTFTRATTEVMRLPDPAPILSDPTSGRMCGMGLAASPRSLVWTVSCATRGHFTASDTTHLTTYVARSDDGVNWGRRGTNNSYWTALPAIEAIEDIRGGATAASLALADSRIVSRAFYSDTAGYAVTDDGFILSTADGGRNWARISGALLNVANGERRVALRGIHCSADGTKLWVVGDWATIIRNTASGSDSAWKIVRTSHPILKNRDGNVYFAFPTTKSLTTSNALRDVVVMNSTGSHIAACGDGGQVWLSTNSGETWTNKRIDGATSPHRDTVYHSIALRDNATSLIVCGSPDRNNDGKRIAYATSVTTTPTWNVTDVATPTADTLFALTKVRGGASHGFYGHGATLRGMMVGERGAMIAHDTGTVATELLDNDGLRWTSADLHAVEWVSLSSRLIGGSDGQVLRTINYPSGATPPDGDAPTFAGQSINEPRNIRAIHAGASINEFVVMGLEGWAIQAAAMSNRTLAFPFYLETTGEFLIACANTGQGEIELFRSHDDGITFKLQSLSGAGKVVRFTATSNAMAGDVGGYNATGTPAPSLSLDVFGQLLLAVGPGPGASNGAYGVVSIDEGETWIARFGDPALLMPLGGQSSPTAPPGGVEDWDFNRTMVTTEAGKPALWSVVYSSLNRYIGTYRAREWKTAGDQYAPIVPGESLSIAAATARAADPRIVFSGIPVVGDSWISRPRHDHGPQNLIDESPTINCRLLYDDARDPMTIFMWDRKHVDAVAVLGAGDKWELTAFPIFGTLFLEAYLDVAHPQWDAAEFPAADGSNAETGFGAGVTEPPDGGPFYSRYVLNARIGRFSVTSIVGNVYKLSPTAGGSGPGQWQAFDSYEEGHFAPGHRTFYAELGNLGQWARVVASGLDWIQIEADGDDAAIAGPNPLITVIGDRVNNVAGTVVGEGGGEEVIDGGTVDVATSAYRFSRLIRLVIPASGLPQTPTEIGEVGFGVATPVSAAPISGAEHVGFAMGFGWQAIVSTVEDVSPGLISSVEHLGIGQRWRIFYPAAMWDQRDQLLNLLTKDGRIRQAFTMVFDSTGAGVNGPNDSPVAQTAHWVRWVDAPECQQIIGDRFSLAGELREVK